MIQYASDSTFNNLIKNGFVIVDFFGKTCIPCKMIARELEDLEDEFPFLNIVKVDADECPETSERFQVEGIPDLYFYKNGTIVHHEIGAINGDELKRIIAQYIYQ